MTMLDGLTDYFAARQQERDKRVVDKWTGLSRREQRLVREAAVMGYVQGYLDGKVQKEHAKDTAIVRMVLEAVDHFADLYPFLAALPKRKRLPRAVP